jgi:hypothetical protein
MSGGPTLPPPQEAAPQMMVTHGKTALYVSLTLALMGAVMRPSPGLAQIDPNRDASVGLYIVDAGTPCQNVPKFGCDGSPTVKGDLNTPYYVYLAVFNGDPEVGIAGLSCGIDYASGSTVVHAWQLCTHGLEFPSDGWPAPGGGNKMTFNPQTECQTDEPGGNGVTAVFGYFYVTAYGADQIHIVNNRSAQHPELAITQCDPPATTLLDYQERGGYVGFGGEDGKLPCVEKTDTTWGRLKSTYKNNK